MKMKDFDFLLCTQMTVERAMFAFMLQLSFYQNISPSRLPPLIVNTSTFEVLLRFEILNGDFLKHKKQHSTGLEHKASA
jgi:hypothetical protein